MAVGLAEQRPVGGVVQIDALVVGEEEFHLAHRIAAARQFAKAQHLFARGDRGPEIGRAHVCTPVTNAHLVCRLLLEKKKKETYKYSARTYMIKPTATQLLQLCY